MGGTVETKATALLKRIRNSEIVDDRRRAVEELQDLTAVDLSSHDELGRDGMAVLVAVLRADAETDPDIARNCLEALVNICTMQRGRAGDDAPVGSSNSARFVAVAGAMELLLDLLAQNDFYVRFATCQLLTAIYINQPQAVQDAFKSNTAGVGSLMDAMADSRHKAMIAKEALMLMVQLTQTSVEIKMAVVFDGAFDRTFEIITRAFEDDMDGGIVVKDALDLLHNLLRDTPPNQTYFRENGDTVKLAKMLQLEAVRSARATSNPALLQNLDLMVEVVQALVSGSIAGTLALVQNQTKLGMDGVLTAMLDVATAEGQSTAIRTSALHCVERMVVDHATNSKLLTDYCRKRSLSLKLHRTMAISITPARPDGADSLSDSIANAAAAGGMDAMMKSISTAEGAEHAALRLSEAEAELDAEKERVQRLQAELSAERSAREEQRAQAAASTQQLEQRVEMLTDELASVRRLSDARAASSSDVLELERRVTGLTAELAAAHNGLLRQTQDGPSAPSTEVPNESAAEQDRQPKLVQAQVLSGDVHELQHTALQAQLDAAKASYETLQAQLQENAKAFSEERAAASTHVLTMEQRVSELTRELAAAGELRGRAKGEQDEHALQLQALQEAHETYRLEVGEQLADLKRQLGTAVARNDSLQSQLQTHAGALTEVRASASTEVLALEERLGEPSAELTDARRTPLSAAVTATNVVAGQASGDSVFAAGKKLLTPSSLRDGSASFDPPNAVYNSYVPGNCFDKGSAQLREQLPEQQEALQLHALELSEERASASAKVLELEQRMNELTAELVVAQEGHAGVEEEHALRLQALQESHAAQQAELESRIQTARTEVEALQAQAQSHALELSEERAVSSSSISELQESVSEANEHLLDAREQAEEAKRRTEEQSAALVHEASRSDALAEQLEKLVAHETESSDAIIQYQLQHKESGASLASARAEMESLLLQLEQNKSELTEAKEQLAGVSDLQRVHLELEGQSGELEEQVFLLKAELSAVKQSAAQEASEHGSIQETLRTAAMVATERLRTELQEKIEAYTAEMHGAEEQRREEAANLSDRLELSRDEVHSLEAKLKNAEKGVERETAELQQCVQELTRQLSAATEEVAMTRADAEKEIAQLAKDETDILIWCAQSIHVVA